MLGEEIKLKPVEQRLRTKTGELLLDHLSFWSENLLKRVSQTDPEYWTMEPQPEMNERSSIICLLKQALLGPMFLSIKPAEKGYLLVHSQASTCQCAPEMANLDPMVFRVYPYDFRDDFP